MPNSTSPALLSPNETAEILKVSPQTLARWRRASQPQGPRFLRVGRQVRYPAEALQEYLQNAYAHVGAA